MNPKKPKPTRIEVMVVVPRRTLRIAWTAVVLITIFNLISIWKIWDIKKLHVPPVALELNIDGVYTPGSASSKLVDQVAARFDIPVERSKEIVTLAKAYEDKTFPTRDDLLAVIAVESSFNPLAENAGAYGLMQIQYGHHRDKAPSKASLYDPWQNIGVGAAILKQYYQILRSREGAIIAYQAGIGSYLAGDFNMDYLDKFNQAKFWFAKIRI